MTLKVYLGQTEAWQEVSLLLQISSSEPDCLSDIRNYRHLLARLQALRHGGQSVVGLGKNSLNKIKEIFGFHIVISLSHLLRVSEEQDEGPEELRNILRDVHLGLITEGS